MTVAVTLPRTMDEITADWLTAALAGKYPGTEVTSLFVGTIVHGSATKIRLLLTYNDAGHMYRLPATMFAKGNFEAASGPDMAACARSEAIFYRDLAPQVEEWLNVPKCYFAGVDGETGDAFLLLEDLLARNVSFGFALRPVNAETAKQTVGMLARFHAKYWDAPGIVRREITAGARLVTDTWMLEPNFSQCAALPRFDLVAPELRDRERFQRAAYRLWDLNAEGPHCLLLGDLHLGNMFFDADGSPGFLDMQGDTRGCWAHDFTEFLMTALAVDDRRKLERPLLEHYLDQLRVHGVEVLSFDQAWLQYRRNTLWVATAAVCPVSSQHEPVCTAYTERAMTAVMDLGALALLE